KCRRTTFFVTAQLGAFATDGYIAPNATTTNTMNRRSFLAKAGLASAVASTSGLLAPAASANSGQATKTGAMDPNPNGAVDLGQTFKAAPTDHGGALINP